MCVCEREKRNLAQGGIVAENIGPLALYCESTMKAGAYENRAVLKRRYENRALLIGGRAVSIVTHTAGRASIVTKYYYCTSPLSSLAIKFLARAPPPRDRRNSLFCAGGVVLTVCGKVVGEVCVTH